MTTFILHGSGPMQGSEIRAWIAHMDILSDHGVVLAFDEIQLGSRKVSRATFSSLTGFVMIDTGLGTSEADLLYLDKADLPLLQGVYLAWTGRAPFARRA